MTTIIAGRFEQQSQAQEVVAEMMRAGFPEDQISSFYVTPAGQHDSFPTGGDHDISPGAEHTPEGRTAGWAAGGTVGAAVGAAIGAVTAPVTGPLGAATGALVGAHVASLPGALGATKDDGSGKTSPEPLVRQAGMMVAVGVPGQDKEGRAVEVLRSAGATDIERAEGTIEDGDWKDFDPTSPPSLLESNRPSY